MTKAVPQTRAEHSQTNEFAGWNTRTRLSLSLEMAEDRNNPIPVFQAALQISLGGTRKRAVRDFFAAMRHTDSTRRKAQT